MRAFAEVVGDCNSDSDSDCEFEFGVELELVSFFEFCERNNHSTIIQPAAQSAAHNVNATAARTHLMCNHHKQTMQQHTGGQHAYNRPAHNQDTASTHSRSSTHIRTAHSVRNLSVAITLSNSICHNQPISRNQPESVAISLSQP